MESAKQRCERMLSTHSKTLPRIFGDPLLQGIGKPDTGLADESSGDIAAYTLGYLQELAARVQQYCEDESETPERKREACQLLVHIASEAAADIHLLVQSFPEPFRAIAENRSNFPCLFPAHSEDIRKLKRFVLDDLKLGKLHPLKLRSQPKTFSKHKYANRLLLHYLAEIRRMQAKLLSFRLNDPWASDAIPRLQIERLDDEIPLSVSNVKPWMDVIWQLLLRDIPQPEGHQNLRTLGSRPSRTERVSRQGSPRLVKRRRKQDWPRFAQPRRQKKAIRGEMTYIRSAIKEALAKYLFRMLRKDEQTERRTNK
jgi:hypothetical protein